MEALAIVILTGFGIPLTALPLVISIQAWKRRHKKARNVGWIDVKREVQHECLTPYDVQDFKKLYGYGYNLGDVIECKTCAQRWRCASINTTNQPFEFAQRYRWARVSENEDVFA